MLLMCLTYGILACESLVFTLLFALWRHSCRSRSEAGPHPGSLTAGQFLFGKCSFFRLSLHSYRMGLRRTEFEADNSSFLLLVLVKTSFRKLICPIGTHWNRCYHLWGGLASSRRSAPRCWFRTLAHGYPLRQTICWCLGSQCWPPSSSLPPAWKWRRR